MESKKLDILYWEFEWEIRILKILVFWGVLGKDNAWLPNWTRWGNDILSCCPIGLIPILTAAWKRESLYLVEWEGLVGRMLCKDSLEATWKGLASLEGLQTFLNNVALLRYDFFIFHSEQSYPCISRHLLFPYFGNKIFYLIFSKLLTLKDPKF